MSVEILDASASRGTLAMRHTETTVCIILKFTALSAPKRMDYLGQVSEKFIREK